MAAPVDDSRATYDGSTSSTSHSVPYPATVNAGDLLLTVIRTATAPTSISAAGFTALSGANDRSDDPSDDMMEIAIRTATGSEGGGTFTVTLGTAARMSAITYRITGSWDTVDIGLAGGPSTGTSANPDNPNHNYIGTAHDILWLAVGGIEGAVTITTAPTSFVNATVIANTGTTGNGQCSVFGASLGETGVTNRDPSAWTVSASNDWMTWTIAIYVAAPRGRLTSEPVEVAYLPDAPKARLTSLPVEVAHQTQPPFRVSQLPVEALVREDNARVRVSQEPVEVLVREDNARVRLSQLPVEVLIEVVAITAPPFQAYIID